MGIGNRIKEARERLGLTQTELGNMVGVTGSAITNYEKETSHPKEQVIYKLMETLDVDANYIFQDMVKPKPSKNDISLFEYDMIKKYRELDERGKEMVDSILEQAYRSRPTIAEGQLSLIPSEDGYWQIWRNGRWENYKKCDGSVPDVMAAHNDHVDEPGEMEKMKEDLETLKRPE